MLVVANVIGVECAGVFTGTYTTPLRAHIIPVAHSDMRAWILSHVCGKNVQAGVGFAMEWMDTRLTGALNMPRMMAEIDYTPEQSTHPHLGPFGDLDKMMAEQGGEGEPLPPAQVSQSTIYYYLRKSRFLRTHPPRVVHTACVTYIHTSCPRVCFGCTRTGSWLILFGSTVASHAAVCVTSCVCACALVRPGWFNTTG